MRNFKINSLFKIKSVYSMVMFILIISGLLVFRSSHKMIIKKHPNVPAKSRNVDNFLRYKNLKVDFPIEFIACSDRINIYFKGHQPDTELKELKNKRLKLSQYHNSLAEQNISKCRLNPFVPFVSDGNTDLIIPETDG